MNNSNADDDIDFLIITKRNTIWTTRFLACLITDLLKVRRHPKDKTFKDKICLNMFLDEDHLKIKDQNIYTAHELLQAKPLFDKNNTYQKFILANLWAKKYLPNAYSASSGVANKAKRDLTPPRWHEIIFKILEPILSLLQKQYMAKKITKEKISEGQLFFHPKNTQREILKTYNENV